MPYDASKSNDEMTDLEKGLTRWNRDKAQKIYQLNEQLDKRTKFTIDLLKDNHDKLKEFYMIGGFVAKGYKMTELIEYTNKRGKKSMKHYVGTKYLKYQPKSDVPVLITWTTPITEKTIELFDIDGDGMLVANEERFKRYEEERLEYLAQIAHQTESESDDED